MAVTLTEDGLKDFVREELRKLLEARGVQDLKDHEAVAKLVAKALDKEGVNFSFGTGGGGYEIEIGDTELYFGDTAEMGSDTYRPQKFDTSRGMSMPMGTAGIPVRAIKDGDLRTIADAVMSEV